MPRYIIERVLPGAGQLSDEQLQAVARKSCSVLENLGPKIQWIESYVTNDKIYCVYLAPDEALVREHARLGGFPANSVVEVKRVIDPVTAESGAPKSGATATARGTTRVTAATPIAVATD